MTCLTKEEKATLERRKEELLSQAYTEQNSRIVERIDILVGVQDGR